MRGMLTIDDLETGWRERMPAPRERGTVTLICVRKGEGRHETPATVQITPGLGLVGDRWVREHASNGGLYRLDDAAIAAIAVLDAIGRLR